nr:hypothetical protein [Sulfurimonas sp.]
LRVPKINELKHIRTRTVGFKDDSKYKFHIKNKYLAYMPMDRYVEFWSATSRDDYDDEYFTLDFSLQSNSTAFYTKDHEELYTICVE